MILSFLFSSLHLLGSLVLKCYCTHPAPMKATQSKSPHFICSVADLRTIRSSGQVLASNKNGANPNAFGQCGRYSGVWVCGCRRVREPGWGEGRASEPYISADSIGPAHTALFPDPRVTIKRTSSKQAVLEAPFHLHGNPICVS